MLRQFLFAFIFSIVWVIPVIAQVRIAGFPVPDSTLRAGTPIPPYVRNNALQLTDTLPNSTASAWYLSKLPVSNGFSTRFRFRMHAPGGQLDPLGDRGGDGFAFVLYWGDPYASGGSGGFMNFYHLSNRIAIEFDTYFNPDPLLEDPNGNHLSVYTNTAPGPVATSTAVPDLNDGAIHTAWIRCDDQVLEVYIDDCVTPVLSTALNIPSSMKLDHGRAFVGFTAATSSAWQYHEILDWSFNGYGFEPDDHVYLCDGGSTTLSAPAGLASYRWNTGATTRSITVSQPGTYTVTVTDTLGCRSQAMTWSAVVESHPAPHPDLGADTIRICEGQTATIAAEGPFREFHWSNGESTPSISAVQAGRYWVEVVDTAGCAGRSDTVTVLVAPDPQPVIRALGPTTTCGDSVELVTQLPHDGYRWSTGDTTRRIVVRQSATVRVTVTNGSGCEATSDPIVVAIAASPEPHILPEQPGAICRGERIELTVSGTFSQYHWNTGDTSRSITVSDPGEYWVDAVNEAGCMGRSDSVRVEVADTLRPTVVADGPLVLCDGGSVVLAVGRPYETYRWSTGESTPSITVSEPGTYSVAVTSESGCSGTSDAIVVAAGQGPEMRIQALGPALICRGQSVGLRAEGDAVAWRWSTGETTREITADTPGVYRVVGWSQDGCQSEDTLRVLDGGVLPVDAGENVEICRGDTVRLHALGGTVFRWTPSAGLSCIDCDRPYASPRVTTTYRVEIADPSGCSGIDSVVVYVDTTVRRARTRVGDSLAVRPGHVIEVPISIIDSLTDADVGEVTVEIRYDSTQLKLDDPTGDWMIADGIFAGWTMGEIRNDPGEFIVRLIAPPGGSLRDTGVGLRPRFLAFLGAHDSADFDIRFELPGEGCAALDAVAGTIHLDSICGLSTRLIDVSPTSYSLRQNAPNPFSDRTLINFSLGLDGPTRLSLYDASGCEVARLIDERLAAGRYAVTVESAGLSSGVYTCRLEQGRVVREIRMVVAR